MTFALSVTFRLHEGHLDEFLPRIVENARTSREVEPGCRVFDVAIPEAVPDTVFLWEIYDDRAAFDTHLSSLHFKTFDAATATMVASKTVEFFRVVP